MGETNIFKVLADSQRRDILIMLRNERLNAGEIAEKLQITPAALSYHLKLLKNADLISEYKEKNFVYYEINTTVFDELIIWVNQFGGKDHVMSRDAHGLGQQQLRIGGAVAAAALLMEDFQQE